jgi:hypothetical protein
MPTGLVPCGSPTTLTQNVVYALPVVKTTLFTDTATPTIQLSNTSAFTTNVAVTLTGGTATLTGGFIRSTAGDALVTLKRD